MLNELLNDLLQEIENKLLDGSDKNISSRFNKLSKLLNLDDERSQDLAFDLALDFVADYCSSNPQNSMEDFIKAMLNNLVKETKAMAKTYVINTSLDGLDAYVSRKIEIPACATMSDLCAIILNAYGCDSYHMCELEYQGESFDMLYDSDFYRLGIMGIRKGTKMKLLYDFGESYEINIKFEEVIKLESMSTFKNLKVIESKGGYIFEDNHQLMYFYYTDRKYFNQLLEDYGYESDDFIEETLPCQIEELNDNIIEQMLITKQLYLDDIDEFDNMNDDVDFDDMLDDHFA